jgi:tRNA pseudouridine38-40 synthase
MMTNHHHLRQADVSVRCHTQPVSRRSIISNNGHKRKKAIATAFVLVGCQQHLLFFFLILTTTITTKAVTALILLQILPTAPSRNLNMKKYHDNPPCQHKDGGCLFHYSSQPCSQTSLLSLSVLLSSYYSADEMDVEEEEEDIEDEEEDIEDEDPAVSSSSSSLSMVRYRGRVAYDGTGFFGFQLQGGGRKQQQLTQQQQQQQQRTVQGVLEAVLLRRFQRVVKVVGAGRTDAGVHARGQAFHFDLWSNETSTTISTSSSSSSSSSSFTSTLQQAMNRMLLVSSSDVVVWNLQKAPPPPSLKLLRKAYHLSPPQQPSQRVRWNAMLDATSKLYSYRICFDESAMDPLQRHYVWHYPYSHEILPLLVVEKDQGGIVVGNSTLGDILQCYVGTHDFICFAGSLVSNQRKHPTGRVPNTVRTIHSIDLVQERVLPPESINNNNNNNSNNKCSTITTTTASGGYYRIDIRLDGALYKMIRNLVGTALEVCRGRIDYDSFITMIERPRQFGLTRDHNPARPAPPFGLTLERVYYIDDDHSEKDHHGENDQVYGNRITF